MVHLKYGTKLKKHNYVLFLFPGTKQPINSFHCSCCLTGLLSNEKETCLGYVGDFFCPVIWGLLKINHGIFGSQNLTPAGFNYSMESVRRVFFHGSFLVCDPRWILRFSFPRVRSFQRERPCLVLVTVQRWQQKQVPNCLFCSTKKQESIVYVIFKIT